MFAVRYSYTFQVCRFEKHHKGCLKLYQEKPHFHSELDSTLQTKEDVPNWMQTILIHHR
jgi:hypothetical protein